jgi:hypothetical protein
MNDFLVSAKKTVNGECRYFIVRSLDFRGPSSSQDDRFS